MKLLNMIRLSPLEDATPETMEILKDISRKCDPGQRIQNAPKRFQVTPEPENVRVLDIIYIDRDSDL